METKPAIEPVVKQRVIVNADDLGLSEKVNDAIFSFLETGRVKSATMIANADAFEGAALRSKQYKHCSFGVHLNLTQFKPLSRNRGLSALVGPDGQLSSQWRSRIARPSLLSAAFEELSAQIERAQSMLGSISHIDSHHHVHTIPALFPVLAALVRKYRIRKVRISRNLFERTEPKSAALLLKKRMWNLALRRGLGVRTTDYFADLASFVDAVPSEQCTVEVMVHPGHDGYADESDLLAREWWAGLRPQMSFISFLEL
jgi:chitin disaccharide deacetylase